MSAGLGQAETSIAPHVRTPVVGAHLDGFDGATAFEFKGEARPDGDEYEEPAAREKLKATPIETFAESPFEPKVNWAADVGVTLIAAGGATRIPTALLFANNYAHGVHKTANLMHRVTVVNSIGGRGMGQDVDGLARIAQLDGQVIDIRWKDFLRETSPIHDDGAGAPPLRVILAH
jgi:hypothetical protein